MTTLKQAIAEGKLDQFIAEHADELGDADQLEATIQSMVGKSPKVQGASAQDSDES